MDECFGCGVSEDKTRLFDAIFREGIVKVCDNCSLGEDIVLIGKFQNSKTEEKVDLSKLRDVPVRRSTVYERLSRMAGITENKEKVSNENKELLEKQETILKEIVNDNLDKVSSEESTIDLVDNFHWVVMRTRRLKKLTQEQLAKEIAEPEEVIKMVEQGVFQGGNSKVIDKLEKYLEIKITKESDNQREKSPKLSFDSVTAKTLTISNLVEMKKEKEAKIFEKTEEKQNSEESEKREI